MADRTIDTSSREIDYTWELIRCRHCRWLGRETPVVGKYRCNRTWCTTTLDDFCSRAVVRDA